MFHHSLYFFERLINLWTATNLFVNNEWLRVISLLDWLHHIAILLMQRSMNVKAHRVWMEVVRISLTTTAVIVWMDSQEGIVRSVKIILISMPERTFSSKWRKMLILLKEINECSSSPCVNGTCNDVVNNYTCTCFGGFEGRDCGIGKVDCISSWSIKQCFGCQNIIKK